VLSVAYKLSLALYAATSKFEKPHRYTLGQRLDSAALELLVALVQTAVAPPGAGKIKPLERASEQVTLLRILVRLAKDIRMISLQQYASLQAEIDEVGRMVGNWLRHAQSQKAG